MACCSPNLYDLDLNAIGTVDVGGTLGGMTFDARGRNLYAYNIGQGVITKYETQTWTVEKTYQVGTTDWNNTVSYGDQLVLSPDGKHLSIMDTNKGTVRILDLDPPRATEPFATVGDAAFGAADSIGQPSPLRDAIRFDVPLDVALA